MSRKLLWLIALASPLLAADLSAPLAGFVWDGPAAVVRPLSGVAGAWYRGAPVDVGFDIAMAAIAPGQDILLAVDTAGAAHLVRLGGELRAVPLGVALDAARAIVFSPAGTAALVVSGDAAVVIAGLPDAPAVRRVALDAGATAWAIADDGLKVASVPAGAVAFASGAHEPIVRSGAAALAVLPTGGVLAAYPDGRIESEDASGKVTAVANCGCVPAGLVRMGTLYLLRGTDGGVVRAIDAKGGDLKLWFIPAS